MINSSKQNQKKVDNKGFTLLFAVIVSVLVLAVASSIINLAIKQIILSGVNRESQYAFYAANTGVECAYFWDRLETYIVDSTSSFSNKLIFATSSDSDTFDIGDPEASKIRCGSEDSNEKSLYENGNVEFYNGSETTELVASKDTNSATTTFWIDFDYNNNGDIDNGELPYCAKVQVEKNRVSVSQPGVPPYDVIETTITSFGYNTCDVHNPRRIERGIKYTY